MSFGDAFLAFAWSGTNMVPTQHCPWGSHVSWVWGRARLGTVPCAAYAAGTAHAARLPLPLRWL